MLLRKFSADKIFNGFHFLNESKVLIFNQAGMVETVMDKSEAGDDVQHFDGILLPGLVNCHCHSELSHMKGVIPVHTGLVDFLLGVIKNREERKEWAYDQIIAAENEMYENGIVAVADICNTPNSIPVKKSGRLIWHNLIEVINLFDSRLEKAWLSYNRVLNQYDAESSFCGRNVLTPHAPYTVSPATHRTINEDMPQKIISIHNQETKAENELFMTGSGDFLRFYQTLGLSQIPITVSGKTSLQTYLPYYTNGQTILLVHNTFISEEDILFAKAHAAAYGINIIYCLCPNANIYIENTLPPVNLLLKHNCTMALGTDSYSSNWQLSIAAEIKALLDSFPQLPLETVLQWATSNGATALNITDKLGSFEKGKTPGLVLLETTNEHITGKSKRIV